MAGRGVRSVSGAPFIGRFFIFLHNAADIRPVKIQFRDHEEKLKGKETPSIWHEKVFLSPTLLQRKWIDYRYTERFISSARYDNILPLEMDYPFLNRIGEETVLRIRSTDKIYRNVHIHILNDAEEKVFHKELKRLPLHSEITITFSTKLPGMYTVVFSAEDQVFKKSSFLYYRNKSMLDYDNRECDEYQLFLSFLENNKRDHKLFCTYCKSACMPAEPLSTPGYVHKNYIPVKEYLDFENLGTDRISRFIMSMDHPLSFKRGLIHLLNMLRLASVDDEITIVTNLFKDDPSFAYFITDRLFLFNMIPLMENRELQNILNRIDDSLLASSLIGQGKELRMKVLNNISRRRSVSVQQEMHLRPRGYDGKSARRDMHRLIKSFFEERFGRELKIRMNSKIYYRVKGLFEHFSEGSCEDIFNHNGSFVFFTGADVYELLPPSSFIPSIHTYDERCLRYDMETYLTNIVTVNGVSESTVYLMTNFGIRFVLIHIYNWNDSLEDTERLENLGKHTIIPVRISSSAVILTLGAIDARGRPGEQVIRLKTRGG